MKKITATILMATLALIPATSSWAGGTSGPSAKVQSESTSSITRETGGPSSERAWAVGCWRGQGFVVDIDDHGNFSGHLMNYACDMGDYFHIL